MKWKGLTTVDGRRRTIPFNRIWGKTSGKSDLFMIISYNTIPHLPRFFCILYIYIHTYEVLLIIFAIIIYIYIRFTPSSNSVLELAINVRFMGLKFSGSETRSLWKMTVQNFQYPIAWFDKIYNSSCQELKSLSFQKSLGESFSNKLVKSRFFSD